MLVEDADELLADNLALLLRINDAPERAEEVFGGVCVNEISLEVAVEGVAYCLRLALTHHAVVDEDAGEAVADCALNQGCRNRGIHTAGEGADDLAISDLLTNAVNAVIHKVAGGP